MTRFSLPLSSLLAASRVWLTSPHSLGSNHGFLITLKMDVTSRKSINKAVEQVERLTDGKLDFLVNCEECKYFVPILDAGLSQSRAQYEVNVWGVVRVVQAFFPLLQEGSGTVVTLGHSASETGRSYGGVYESSKAAVKSLTKAMRFELAPSGIGAVCLDAPDMRVESFENRGEGGVGEESVHWPIRGDVEAVMERSLAGEKGQDRFDVAERMVEELLNGQTLDLHPKKESWQIMLTALLAWILPTWLLEGLNARAAGLYKLEHSLTNAAPHERKKST